MSDPLLKLMENNPEFKNIMKGLTCAAPECPLVALNSRFCDSHRCAKYWCSEKRAGGQIYCNPHACVTCGALTVSLQKYCEEHLNKV